MFCLANIIVKLTAKAFQHKMTFTHYILNYWRHGFLKLVNANSLLANKNMFPLFLYKKKMNAIKSQTAMRNHIKHMRAELKTFLFHMSCDTCHVSLKGLLSTDFTSCITYPFIFFVS